MALDHANLFVGHSHSPGEHWFAPLPQYDSASAFLTRLVTHPVAPGFFFLMGIGMAMFAASRLAKGWTQTQLITHFLVRGTILIVLQFTVVNLAWRTGPTEQPTFYFGVLAALGSTMILGSLLLRLGPKVLAALALALFIGMELTHPDPEQWESLFDKPFGLVFGYSGGDGTFWSNYPVLAWLEVVVFGLAFGKWMLHDRQAAARSVLPLGVLFLGTFAAIRALDGFGNIRPQQGDDWISFFNGVKYPPAMTFTLLAIGVILVVLALLNRAKEGNPVVRGLAVFGRVPLFFYIAHLYTYSLLGVLFAPNGTSLGVMYLYWLLGLALLYPLCLIYGRFKATRPNSLLRFV